MTKWHPQVSYQHPLMLRPPCKAWSLMALKSPGGESWITTSVVGIDWIWRFDLWRLRTATAGQFGGAWRSHGGTLLRGTATLPLVSFRVTAQTYLSTLNSAVRWSTEPGIPLLPSDEHHKGKCDNLSKTGKSRLKRKHSLVIMKTGDHMLTCFATAACIYQCHRLQPSPGWPAERMAPPLPMWEREKKGKNKNTCWIIRGLEIMRKRLIQSSSKTKSILLQLYFRQVNVEVTRGPQRT